MKRFLVLGLMFVVVLAAFPLAIRCEAAKPARQYILPPQANVFGKCFDEWMSLYWHWFWPDYYGVPGPPDHLGKVTFLRVPVGGGELSSTVKKGQFLVVPLVVLTGERYDRYPAIPDDDPADFFPDQYLQFQLKIDGVIALDSDVDDATRYLFDVANFDPPLEYPEPEYRFTDDEGDVFAVAAVWSQGTGCILHPLPVGEHTVETRVYFPVFDLTMINIMHVTVTK